MAAYLHRNIYPKLMEALQDFPVVCLLGPRQVGKSTLCRDLLKIPDRVYLDLQKEEDRRKLSLSELYFEQHQGKLICLDEIQEVPQLFPSLRAWVDVQKRNGQFLILGSASRDLLRQSSESLAGRIAYLEMQPFTLDEISNIQESEYNLWLRGGFPKSFLAKSDSKSIQWRDNFIQTYLERDIPQLGFNVPPKVIEKLWKMLAHMQGQVLNVSKIASAFGVSSHTIVRYMDILEQTFMIYQLRPYENNLKKRYIKSPKIYIRDTGILHSLLRLDDLEELMAHPVLGFSYETFVLEHVKNAFPRWQISFYRSKSGAEIDIVLSKGIKTIAVELKFSKAPKVSKGFHIACRDLGIDQKYVICKSNESYDIEHNTRVLNLQSFLNLDL